MAFNYIASFCFHRKVFVIMSWSASSLLSYTVWWLFTGENYNREKDEVFKNYLSKLDLKLWWLKS